MESGKRILIAEDEEADVILIQIALKEFGLKDQWAVAGDGQEALDYLYCRGRFETRPRGNPELMLLDMKLPKVSGLEVLGQMRADGRFGEVAIVVFSSSLDEKDQAGALAAGANEFMIKPMGFDAFRMSINRAISTYLQQV
jgi:CheY-like chemotaxis protein